MVLGTHPQSAAPRPSINVTPLIDVVLVLLIIFMVASPRILEQLQAVIPHRVDTRPSWKLPIVVGYRHGVLLLNQQPTTETALPGQVGALLARRPDKAVFFEIGDDASYGMAVHLMAVVRGAGATTLALTTPD